MEARRYHWKWNEKMIKKQNIEILQNTTFEHYIAITNMNSTVVMASFGNSQDRAYGALFLSAELFRFLLLLFYIIIMT